MICLESLKKKWDSASETILKFSVSDTTFKIITGDLAMVAILNENRNKFKRPTDGFNSSGKVKCFEKNFKFTDVRSEEVLVECDSDVFLINASPINKHHFLFAPNMVELLEQKILGKSLEKTLRLVGENRQKGFFMGFNSPNAWATVNHLHYHGLFIDAELPVLKSVPFQRLGNTTIFFSDYLFNRQTSLR